MADPYGDAWDDDHARIHFSGRELLHLLASVVVLTLAFALVLGARNDDFSNLVDVPELLRLLPYAAVAVVPAFILHELAHKIVAQRRDMWAEFRANPIGLVGGLVVTALTGFLFALPGAVEIVGHADRRDAGVISIVGPMVNVGIAGLAMALEPLFPPIRVSDFGSFFELIVLLNLILAGFNMIPLGPLDGRKVWSWSKLGFFGMWALILGMAFVAIAL
ncbi:MAG TPA: metalloprotease [Candidatus Thermoplasmatota archaeon]|nr:metalloprotease [Candidatus Thermoplasmatota archaeon]